MREKTPVRFQARGSAGYYSPTMVSKFRKALDSCMEKGQKVIQVKVRLIEGHRIHGFLLIRIEDRHEKFLLDFQATLTSDGEVSSLEVGDKKIDVPTIKSK